MQEGAFDAAILAALAEPDGVFPDMADFAVLDRDIAGPVNHDRRLGGKGRLVGLIARGGQRIILVMECQALERHPLDELPGFGLAFENQQLLHNRRDDLGLGHILAGARLVVEHAVTGEEPFAGLIDRGLEVLQVEPRAGGPAGVVLQLLARGDDLALLEIHALEVSLRDAPFVIRHKDNITNLGFAESLQWGQGLGRHVRRSRELARLALDRHLFALAHVEIELVGRSRPHGPLAVDEQLLESPLAVRRLRDARSPQPVLGLLESADGLAAGEDRPGARRRLVDDAAVSGIKREWLSQ